jgi:hypothetical protein
VQRLWAEELGSYEGSWRLAGFLPQGQGNVLGEPNTKANRETPDTGKYAQSSAQSFLSVFKGKTVSSS